MTKEVFQDLYAYIRQKISTSKFKDHVFFVGGSVRDFIIGNDINDIDIVVDLPDGANDFATFITKSEGCYVFNSNPVVFQRYGTVKFNISNNEKFKNISIECSNTRKNPSYSLRTEADKKNNIGTILEDSALRDLTMNSLYLDISAGEVIDPQNGIDDITENTLRVSGVPDVVFKDDPLRMMRIIRFASIYNWGIEKNTWLGIVRNHELIKNVSEERITSELNKILLTRVPSYGLTRLMNSGILYDILPQVYCLNHIGDDYRMVNKNVWEHTLKVVDGTEPILLNRLSALFHDIGKVLTYKVIKGQVHFYGHECCGITMAKDILKKLKYPEQVINDVCFVIKHHMRFSMVQGMYTPSMKVLKKFLADVGDKKDLVMDVIKSDFDSYGPSKILSIRYIEEKLEELGVEMDYSKIVLPINGNDIKEHCKISASPAIGEILNIVKDMVVENPNLTKEQALKVAEEHLKLVC